jgi:hypothetical protein
LRITDLAALLTARCRVWHPVSMQVFRIRADGDLSWRDLALAALFFAMLFRAFVPAGFMPQVSAADGTLQIVICTIDGTRTLDGSSREGSALDGALAKSHGPCAFAATPAAPPPAAPVVSVVQAIALVLLPLNTAPLEAPRTAETPHCPRGPPLSRA